MKHMGVRDGVAQSGGVASSGAAQAEARLLVVEDDLNILELLSASLRFAGFEVVTASSGGDAVHTARDARPDLIVLDVMLPDLNGFGSSASCATAAPARRWSSSPRATPPTTRSVG